MFNLIMSSNIDEWNGQVDETRSATFPLARYLEYTDKKTLLKFQPITDENLKFLESIPTLFLSELQVGPAPELEKYVIAKIGRVFNIVNINGNINYAYNIFNDLGKVVIRDRNDIDAGLGLGKFEINRTHWAIKNRDFYTSLHSSGIYQIQAGANLRKSVVPLPPHINNKANYPVVYSVESYLREVMKIQANDGEEFFYRGHSSSEYELVPGLFRKHDNGDPRWLPREHVLVRELLTAQAKEFVTDTSTIDNLVRMQHYGLPTRLLDVSSNPLVALYFACSEDKLNAVGLPSDGEVITLTTKSDDVKYYDSDIVSCISNLCLLTDDEKSNITPTLQADEFKLIRESKKLTNYIRKEKPYFENSINPADLRKIIFVRGRIMHERISSQSGAFLLFGIDAVLPETGKSDLKINRIIIRDKPRILKDLARLNIKASTVYPGIEKTAWDIAKTFELKPTI